MGWSIRLSKNTLVVSRECALEIAKSRTDIGFCCAENGGCEYDDEYNAVWTPKAEAEALGYIWDAETGYLNFDPDHMEHMDFLWDEEIQDIIKRHRGKGEVAFLSTEGDNRDTAWRYVFDGEGDITMESRSLGDIW